MMEDRTVYQNPTKVQKTNDKETSDEINLTTKF
jgi:hypothetical protein